MPDIFDKCDEFWTRIGKLAGEHLDPSVFFRKFPVSNCLPHVELEGKKYLQVATNDYLGLATHPEVIEAATKVVAENGVGTPLGARPLTGNIQMHLDLEAELAKFRRTEASLVFNLGLGAMTGTIACMVGRKERVFVDAYAHGCLHDGAKLCKGEATWFKHNDLDDLESQLKACPIDQPKLIAVENIKLNCLSTMPMELASLEKTEEGLRSILESKTKLICTVVRLQSRLAHLAATFVVPREHSILSSTFLLDSF